MRTTVALAIPLLVGLASGQDAFYYKFESGGGDKVINFGQGEPTVPREATIFAPRQPTSKAWGKGRYGLGLTAGSNPADGYELDTGWQTKITGNATLSFFLRAVHQLPTNVIAPLFGRGDSYEISIEMSGNSTFRGFLSLKYGTRSIALRRNIFDLTAKGWVHIAVSVDIANKRLVWYINGKPELPVYIPGWPSWLRSRETYKIGAAHRSYWMFDEVRLSLRAVPAAEIAAWAAAEPASHAPFGAPCNPKGRTVLLDGATSGLPKIGNASYALIVYGLPQSIVVLGLGSNNQSFLGAPLPLDLAFLAPVLRGCYWRTSAELFRFGTIGSTGALPFALPIPNVSGAAGAKLFSQAILASTALKTTMLTNAFVTVVGK